MEFLSFILISGAILLFAYLFYGNIVMGVNAWWDYDYDRKYKNVHRFPNAFLYHIWWKFFALIGKHKRSPKDIAARNARLFNMEGK